MAPIQQLVQALQSGQAKPLLNKLYGSRPGGFERQAARFIHAIQEFQAAFPNQTDILLFSSPGRTEVGGNHTDHNAGRVLAAAVDLDILCVVAPNQEGVVRIKSEGYSQDTISLSELAPVVSERFTSAALARGVCARMKELGYQIGGFDA